MYKFSISNCCIEIHCVRRSCQGSRHFIILTSYFILFFLARLRLHNSYFLLHPFLPSSHIGLSAFPSMSLASPRLHSLSARDRGRSRLPFREKLIQWGRNSPWESHQPNQGVRNMKRVLFSAVAVLALIGTPVARAQDPVKVDPKHYTVVFENDAVLVLDVHYAVGEKSVIHSHP